MKRGYSKMLYNHRNKDETIMSIIKRLFGKHLMSRLTRTQNRELSFRCIIYNMHRLTNLIILMMFSTKPIFIYCVNHLFNLLLSLIAKDTRTQHVTQFHVMDMDTIQVVQVIIVVNTAIIIEMGMLQDGVLRMQIVTDNKNL